jgi:multidrug/hemolysin transport system permease protein
MKALRALLKRNVKLFFKDKGLFLTSLITPMILLVLYVTFLGNVYRDSFLMGIPPTMAVTERLIDGIVAGQLFSSLLAVSCVTVAFCSNMLMVQDKTSGARRDMLIAPLKASTLGISYYLATMISTLLISLSATAVCLIYVATVGWYLTLADLLLLLLDVFLLVLFGTALSSLVNFFLTSQGQISAVGTIVSSCYGFICGAYMPISQFPERLQKVISFLPGTYGTSLLREHAMRSAFERLKSDGIPTEVIEPIKDIVDCNLYFFDHAVPEWGKYLVLIGSILLLLGAYLLGNLTLGRRKAK